MDAIFLLGALAGLALAFVVPGFLALRIVAPRTRDVAATFVVSVTLSVAITIVAGSILGFLGRFDRNTLLAVLVGTTILLGAGAVLRGAFAKGETTGPPAHAERGAFESAAKARARAFSARQSGDDAALKAAETDARAAEEALERSREAPR